MLHQQRLQLGRRDLVALVLDHLFLAVVDADVAIGVRRHDVAGAQPAVGGHRLGRGFRLVPVAEHHLRAVDEQLADLAVHQLFAGVEADDLFERVRDRRADGAFARRIERVEVGDGARFRHAVRLEDDGAGDLLRGLTPDSRR